MDALKFAELKERLQSKTERVLLEHHKYDLGLPIGAITEVSGPGKTQFTLQFLASHPNHAVAWVEENFCAFPFGFAQHKVKLSRVLFVDAKEQIEWAALQVLRAQIFGVVILYAESIDLNALRRIQLASEKSGVCTIWLSPEPQNLWPVSLQIGVARKGRQIIPTILKRKF